MKLILGLDAGSSSTKLMAMTEDGAKFIVPMRMGPMHDHRSFCAALSRFAADNGMTEENFAYIAATGRCVAEVGEEVLGVPVRRVNEMDAMTVGALRFSGKEKGVVVNMGTGTTAVYAEKGKAPQHIFASAVGGGTLLGLGSQLLDTKNYTEMLFMADKGDRTKVDIGLSEFALADVETLDSRLTLSNFGKVHAAAAVEKRDLAASLVNMILETVSTETALACRSTNCDTAIITGGLADIPASRAVFDLFEEQYGIQIVKAGMATYVTAAGALLCTLEQAQ